MGEIKSSIELAMERTARIKLSQEEREKLRADEVHSKAKGLVNRFLEVDLHLREIEKELSKYDPDHRKELERLMFRLLSEALQLDRDNSLILEGLEKLKPESHKTTAQIRDLVSAYHKRREQELGKVTEGHRLRLKQMGISGSAVVPKVPESPEWKTAEASFKPDFEKRLQNLLAELTQ